MESPGLGYGLPAAARWLRIRVRDYSVKEKRRYECFPENNCTSDGCGASHFSFGRRLQQQSEVTDGLVEVSHFGHGKPQLDSEFGASPVRRLRPTVDPGHRHPDAHGLHRRPGDTE